MTLLAHAIAPTAAPAPAVTGLRDAPLRRIADSAGSLGLWATAWDGAPGPLGRDDLLRHHAIVEAIAGSGPCLPVRFGSVVADEAAAVGLLDARTTSFAAALARVAGRSELAVTLLWRDAGIAAEAVPAATGPGTPPGRRFLEARRAALAVTAGRQEEADALATELISLLGSLGIDPADVRHQTCPTAEVAVSLAVLVPGARAAEVKDALTARSGSRVGIRGVVSGPWPAYSFTAELG